MKDVEEGAGGPRLEKDLVSFGAWSPRSRSEGGRVGAGAGGLLVSAEDLSVSRTDCLRGILTAHGPLEAVLQSWGESRRGCVACLLAAGKASCRTLGSMVLGCDETFSIEK